MPIIDPDVRVLNAKKALVTEIIQKACKIAGVAVPAINFGSCPSFGDEQLAHMHPDQYKICFSKKQLFMQNSDDLKHSAIHEVTHLLEANHGPSFKKKSSVITAAMWKTDSRISFVSGETILKRDAEKDLKHKEKLSKIDRTFCNSHFCRKKRKLFKCPHCPRYFCKEHIKPILPGDPNHEISDDRTDFHICPGLVDFVKQKKEAERKVYTEALDQMVGKQNRSRYEIKEPVKTMIEYEHKSETAPKILRQDKTLSDSKQEELNKKTYEKMDTEFGDSHRDNRWNMKRKGIWEKIKEALGIGQ